MLEATPDTYGWAKERILRLMLDPQFGMPAGTSLYSISKQTGAGYGWVHRIWRDLVRAGAFDDHPRGGTLRDGAAAYRYWLQHRPRRVHADYHVVGGVEFLKGIAARSDFEYVATTYLAENLLQGHLFPRRFDLYIKISQQAAWRKELTVRGFPIDSAAEDRGIIRLITADPDVTAEVAPIPDHLVRKELKGQWNNPVRGIWVARPPLLVVDLLEEGGACTEAAHMLMEKMYANAAVHGT